MITSLSNERVKRVRALQGRRTARHKAGLFVIEGPNLMREAILARTPVEEVFYTETFAAGEEGQSLLAGLSQLGATLMAVDGPVMAAMSDTQTPQGVLAVLPVPSLPTPEAPTFVLISDGIADPGNLGTIMRAAAGAGVEMLIVTAGTVDVTNPKVVRSAAGAHFRLPIRQYSWEAIPQRLAGHVVFLADSRGGTPYYDIDWTQPCALIVSDEAHGPSQPARRTAHARTIIPMPGKIESLNVSAAAAVLMFEVARQRSRSQGR